MPCSSLWQVQFVGWSLAMYLGLSATQFGRAHGHGTLLRAVALNSNRLHRMAADRNEFSHGGVAKAAYGDLTCMRWTGGTCWVSGCKSERGPTECIESKCFCLPGYCSSSAGKCVPEYTGKWIGSYAVRFLMPFNAGKPYLGFEKTGTVFGQDSPTLATVANPEPQWRMAMTPTGLVRFESIDMPGRVFSIYNNRRRSDFLQLHRRSSFMQKSTLHTLFQESLNSTNTTLEIDRNASSMDTKREDGDLWPSLKTLDETSPIGATFQVHEVPGGLEIYDPENLVSLATVDTNLWFQDHVAKKGIGDCAPESIFFDGCDGHQLVAFEPALPAGAVQIGERTVLHTIAALAWFHWLLIVACIFGCPVMCILIVMSDKAQAT